MEKILVVAQQAALRLTLCSWLEALLPTVRTIEARDETIGVTLAQSQAPITIVLNAGSASAYSLEMIACLKKAAPHIPLLVVTTYDSESYSSQALKAGADACLPKDMIYGDRFMPLLTKFIASSHQINQEQYGNA
ncbi:MAG: response regulator transcription factor [Anaerolineae bacterium]|nr:response regulator transcription factor [Anaerolineae bacterium]